MKKQMFLLVVAGVVVIAAIILRVAASFEKAPVAALPVAMVTTSSPATTSSAPLVGNDRDAHGCIGSAGYTWCEAKQKCLRVWEEPCALASDTPVQIFLPKPDTVLKSPLAVLGQAPGNWFFEATLPVKLMDASGTILAAGPAQAQSDWTTTNPVPFTVILKFTLSATTTDTGYLVVAKDNPSGLPQNDASFRVPVRFK